MQKCRPHFTTRFGWTIRIIFQALTKSVKFSEDDIIECLAELKNRGFDLDQAVYHSVKCSYNKVVLWCVENGVKILKVGDYVEYAIESGMKIEVIEALINYCVHAQFEYEVKILRMILYTNPKIPKHMFVPLAQLCIKNGNIKLSKHDIKQVRNYLNGDNVCREVEYAMALLIGAHLNANLYKIRLMRSVRTMQYLVRERIYHPDHMWGGKKSHRKAVQA